ncbi:MAG: hypothetical protein M3525_07790 [Acidobacteriota bacterium]|nr:hypothetical protein [Acidobacteriota bacterium]
MKSDLAIKYHDAVFIYAGLRIKVDMLPKAVTERLKTLDDLWILSVKLMNSKKGKNRENRQKWIIR